MNTSCTWDWSSSSPSVARIGEFDGGITTSGTGSATITGKCGPASATAGITVVLADQCDDPAADNYQEGGDCSYDPTVCDDPDADNYGDSGDCTYPPPPPTCSDPAADNYGAAEDCQYPPPPTTCDDPSADNYGGSGDCQYNLPDPPDDPCGYQDMYDPSCDDGGAMYTLRPKQMQAGLVARSVGVTPVASSSSSYYVVLVDRWTDPSVLSKVGRFQHKHGFVDAVYLPAASASGLGFTLAVRALQKDRASIVDPALKQRIIQVKADGSEQFRRHNGTLVAMPAWKPLTQSALAKLDADFNGGVLKKLRRLSKHPSKRMSAVQLLKWPHK